MSSAESPTSKRIVLWEPRSHYAMRYACYLPIGILIGWGIGNLFALTHIVSVGDGTAIGLLATLLMVCRRRALAISEAGVYSTCSQSSITSRLDLRGMELLTHIADVIGWRISREMGRGHLTLILLDRRQVEFAFTASPSDTGALAELFGAAVGDEIA